MGMEGMATFFGVPVPSGFFPTFLELRCHVLSSKVGTIARHLGCSVNCQCPLMIAVMIAFVRKADRVFAVLADIRQQDNPSNGNTQLVA